MIWYHKEKNSSLWISGNYKGITNSNNSKQSNLIYNYINAIKNGNSKRKITIFDTRKSNKNKYLEIKEQIFRNKDEPYFLELDENSKLKSKYNKLVTLDKLYDFLSYPTYQNINVKGYN